MIHCMGGPWLLSSLGQGQESEVKGSNQYAARTGFASAWDGDEALGKQTSFRLKLGTIRSTAGALEVKDAGVGRSEASASVGEPEPHSAVPSSPRGTPSSGGAAPTLLRKLHAKSRAAPPRDSKLLSGHGRA
mmetsp:Transcript_2793/g.8972  ORF Transcript_2793/g.8972 Transcript_2793/m.8972 type:complete len:132 (+) Transcript_2793:1683-2078(+)